MLPSLGEALSAISALSAGRLLTYADSFYCPTEIKEIKEIFVPLGEAFLLFLLFLRDLKHASWLDLFYYPKEMKEIKEIQVSDVALGRPSASKLQGQELQKVN